MGTSYPKLQNAVTLDWRTTTSCDYHRIVLPFIHVDIESRVPVFIFNRICSYGVGFLEDWKAAGGYVIMDIDDHYQVDPSHYLYKNFEEGGMTSILLANLRIADAVFTTTPLLASELKRYNKNIVVIPNALPFDSDQFTLSQDLESGTPFVWAGGASHFNDLKQVKDIFLDDELTMVGFNSRNSEWLKIKEDHPKATYKGELTLKNYMEAYDGHQIVIAPLENSIFNSCKSNLKVLEAGAKGLPIVCSTVEPYYNSVDKNYVRFASNKTEWCNELNMLLKYEDYREDTASALAEHVRLQYNLRDANLLRKQVIQSFS